LLLVGTGAGACILDRSMAFIAIPVLLIALVISVLAIRAFARGDAQGALWHGVLASVVVSLGVYSFGVPVLRSLKLSPRLAEAVASVPCVAPQVITAGYREPSLVFLVGTELAMAADGAAAAQFLAGPGCRVALVEARQQATFDAELARSGTKARLMTRVSGFNINGGRKLDIAVIARSE
ncbi:MAG: glycosyl transferase, partial [Bosea sp. (in: a-proteobacteria)]